MPLHVRSFMLRYGVAAGSIALAIWVRLLLDPVLDLRFPFATVFFAVLVTAWYGGFGPALTAVLLGALASAYFLLPPRGSFALEGWPEQVGLALYLGTSLGIALLGGSMHAARRKAEASDEQHRTLLETLPVGVLIHRDYVPLFANRAFARLLGYDSSVEFLTAAASAQPGFYIPEANRPLQLENHRRRMAGESLPSPIQWRVTRKDQVPVWLETWHHVVAWKGEPAMESIHVDITQRLIAEEELREANQRLAALNQELVVSQERFRKVFDDGPLGMTMTALDLALTHVNAQFCKMLGYTESELLRLTFKDFTHPDDRNLKTGLVEQLRRGEIPILHLENRYIRKDGAILHGSQTAVVVRDNQGQPQFFVAMVEDITARKRTEAELQRANHDLETANKELEAFSYSVSHDLRQPLRGITGFCQMLVEDYREQLDTRAREYLDTIVGQAERMGRLIDEMLMLSRISRQEMERVHVDLTALCNEVVEELRKSEPRRQMDVTVAGQLNTSGDPRLLKIALQNLIGNAWKFTSQRPDARIEIGSRQGEDGPCFFVTDNGAGFNMKYADKLFGAFQRLHRANEFEGIGIGLATVQRIIHRHGGRIRAESEVGKGATFLFSL